MHIVHYIIYIKAGIVEKEQVYTPGGLPEVRCWYQWNMGHVFGIARQPLILRQEKGHFFFPGVPLEKKVQGMTGYDNNILSK